MAGVVALLVASPAFAGVTPWAGMSTNVATACSNQTLLTPFVAWGDSGQYVFAPNGGFESGTTGWALAGPAALLAGNEPWYVHGSTDNRSVSLGSGVVATTPAVCLGANYPWARLFAVGPIGASLRVDLLFVDAGGQLQTKALGSVSGAGNWALSQKLSYPSWAYGSSRLSYTAIDGAKYTAVAFKFTASGGSWKLDDLYVDPFKLH